MASFNVNGKAVTVDVDWSCPAAVGETSAAPEILRIPCLAATPHWSGKRARLRSTRQALR